MRVYGSFCVTGTSQQLSAICVHECWRKKHIVRNDKTIKDSLSARAIAFLITNICGLICQKGPLLSQHL